MLKTSSVFTALPVPVSNGGTGQSSLPVGYVLLGNGLSPIASVAPGASGNILTSDGTTWISSSPGSINLSSPPPIGNVTPNTGTFTTLTATGQTSLGGVAGSESLRVLSNPSYTSWVEARGSSTSNPGIRSSGTGTLQFDISAQSGGSVRFYSASYTTQQFQISHTASAVNYVQVTGAATTATPTISAQGSDTNINFAFTSKGSSGFQFYSQNGGARQFEILNTTSAVNRPTVTGSVTGAAVIFGAGGSDTNIDLALTPKGTGLVSFGTYTAGAPAATGYISIKSAAGVTYKVLVST